MCISAESGEAFHMQERAFSKKITSRIKGFAIIIMMIHHCFLNKQRFEGYEVVFAPLKPEFAMKLADSFRVCVAIYVFITAYGLSKSKRHSGSPGKNGLTTGNLPADPKVAARSSLARWVRLLFNYNFIFAVFLIFGKLNNTFHFVSSNWGFHKVYGHDGMKSLVYFATDALGLANIFHTPTYNGTWWYMSLACLLIFSVPVLVKLYEKYRLPVVLLAGLIPRYLGLDNTMPARYLLITMVGIMMASEGIPEKIQRFVTRSLRRYLLCGLVLTASICLMIYTRCFISNDFCANYVEWFDCIGAVQFIFLVYLYLSEIPVLRDILSFLGKHSMNIFLLHTFYRSTFFKDFVYSFKYALLIVLVLLALSLITSIVLEFIKKKSGFNRIAADLCARITS